MTPEKWEKYTGDVRVGEKTTKNAEKKETVA